MAGTKVTQDSWLHMMHADSSHWKNYVDAGNFIPITPAVQLINRFEFEPNNPDVYGGAVAGYHSARAGKEGAGSSF
ncbi:MAG: hypothetical protein ACLU8D_07840 [Enterocloster sp.]